MTSSKKLQQSGSGMNYRTMFIDGVYVVNGQLRTADGECWPHPAVSLLREFGVEDGLYPVELEMIEETLTDGSTVYKAPTRLIIHFDKQLDQSA